MSPSGALHDVSTAGALFADGIPDPSRGRMAPGPGRFGCTLIYTKRECKQVFQQSKCQSIAEDCTGFPDIGVRV